MASFDEMATIAAHSTFLRRVQYAMKKAAVAVMSEVATTPNHTERVVYAKTILDGTASVPEFANAVVTNSTLTTNGDLGNTPTHNISDADLEFTVNSMFDAMAGVATV